MLDEQELWSITFRVVRLWQLDAAAAVASGLPGLAVLSPLMGGATAQLVEQAAALVLELEVGPQQADLLTILGIFAEPLLEMERFVRMVGRERLMASDLITYLTEERVTEQERTHAAQLEQEQAAREQEPAAVKVLEGSVEDLVIARFPNTPAVLVAGLRQMRDIERLQALHAAVLRAPDQAAFASAVTKGDQATEQYRHSCLATA